MLVTHEKRLNPPMVNIITLFKNGLYYYVDKNVYNQAVILSYKFKNDLEYFKDMFGKEFTEEVTIFYEEAPEPINILAPFLLLVDLDNSVDDVKTLSGALHQIFSVIDGLKFLDTPYEVRASVNFTLSIYEEYVGSWESFIHSCNSSVPTTSNTETTTNITRDVIEKEDKHLEIESSYDFDEDGWEVMDILGLSPNTEEEPEEIIQEVSEVIEKPVTSGLSFLQKGGFKP